MRRIQLIGPLAVFCAVLAADAAAYALASNPASAMLWYLNLDVFALFRKSRALTNEISALPFSQVFLFAGPLLALALFGQMLKRNLLVAISSNLTFVYAAFVTYSGFHWHNVGQTRSASLALVQVSEGNGFYLFVTLLATSFVSFAVSHFLYIHAARR